MNWFSRYNTTPAPAPAMGTGAGMQTSGLRPTPAPIATPTAAPSGGKGFSGLLSQMRRPAAPTPNLGGIRRLF